MCELICIRCECGIIFFPCDVKWVDSRWKISPYKDGVLKVASRRHCVNLNSSEELFDHFESLPDCIKGVAGFGESCWLAIGSLYCSTFKLSNYIPMCIVQVQSDMVFL